MLWNKQIDARVSWTLVTIFQRSRISNKSQTSETSTALGTIHVSTAWNDQVPRVSRYTQRTFYLLFGIFIKLNKKQKTSGYDGIVT